MKLMSSVLLIPCKISTVSYSNYCEENEKSIRDYGISSSEQYVKLICLYSYYRKYKCLKECCIYHVELITSTPSSVLETCEFSNTYNNSMSELVNCSRKDFFNITMYKVENKLINPIKQEDFDYIPYRDDIKEVFIVLANEFDDILSNLKEEEEGQFFKDYDSCILVIVDGDKNYYNNTHTVFSIQHKYQIPMGV